MIHLHITAWLLAVILLFVTVSLYKKGKGTAPHMIMRLMYLVILFSGVMLFMSYTSHSFELAIKCVVGLWVIIAMELISVKAKKGKSATAGWTQFWIAFVIALVLGFGRLPLGVQLFG